MNNKELFSTANIKTIMHEICGISRIFFVAFWALDNLKQW